MQPTQVRLSLGRIFLVGAILPAAFTLLDHALSAGLRDGSAWAPLIFLVYVAQVAALGILSARLIPIPFLRWIVYGWGWLFFDLQSIMAAIMAQHTPQANMAEALAVSLFAAQVGLLTVWATLGSSPHWTLRWPLAIVLSVVPGILALEEGSRSVMQTLALMAICGTLAWQRFRLFRVANDSQPSPGSGGSGGLRVQFGVRHVLIWTTTIAMVLAILRALDLLSLEFVRRFLDRDFLWIATEGAVVAIVLVVSLWAGLGEGPAWLRWPLPFLLGLGGGMGLGFAHWLMSAPYGRIPAARYPGSAWQQYCDYEDERIAWVSLAGGLLFAGVLYFRTQGVRLSRTTQVSEGARP